VVEFCSHQEYVQSKNYVSGEMQFYLGKRYVLKVIELEGAIADVKLLRGKLLVTLPLLTNKKRCVLFSNVYWNYYRKPHG
jgi:hypothetical protein